MNSRMPNSQAPEIKAPKVSVIVPVYNTELYVERAIISLMEQTLDDVQFIIIDDGSKDNSLTIIKQVIARYPARQDQVTLISRGNRGVAATRAQGMELAAGDYVIHLDSDDWAEVNWLEELYSKAIENDSDIVTCDYNVITKKRAVHIKQYTPSNGLECINKMLLGELHGSTWNKLIKRSLIVSNNLSFNKVNYLEDFIFVMQLFFLAKNITYSGLPLINYNQTSESSITSVINESKIKDILKAIDIISSLLIKSGTANKLALSLLFFKLNQKYWMIYCNRHLIPDNLWGLYPETNFIIWKSKKPLYSKVALYLGAHRFYFASKMTILLRDKIKNLFRK